MTTVTVNDLGGTIVEHDIPNVGLLRFEDFAPGQWLTKKGEPAKKPRRRYSIDDQELDSVSSITGTLSKEALVAWAEDHGARGGAQAQRLGELDDIPEEEIILRVRALGLGASAKRDDGADRGHAIHTAFESLALTGGLPDTSTMPVQWRPWLQGAARMWLATRPEAVAVEHMVCHRDLGYAGRPDLVCRLGGALTLLDYKTNKGKVYDSAHYQTRLYEMARRSMGLEPVDRILIVGIDDTGSYQLVECEATEEDALALLHTFRSRKRINAGMATQRRAWKTTTTEAKAA